MIPIRIDEVLLLGSSLAVMYAIPRAVRQHGGFRQCIRLFLQNGKPAEPILLFLLVIPMTMLALYYVVLFFPQVRNNTDLRQVLARPSFFTTNVILAVYFLNGRLVRWTRRFVLWGVTLWNKFGIFRI